MTSATLDSRRVLLPLSQRPLATAAERAAATATVMKVRRYRLGRMPLHTRPDPATDRFLHLRCSYD